MKTATDNELVLELPFPPSVNTYWGSRIIGKGKRVFMQRYINAAGKLFRQAVIDQCLVDNVPTGMAGPLACTIDLYPPCNRKRDCDNFPKGLLDALTHAKVYTDDSQIVDLRIRMFPKTPPGCAVVTLQKISAPQASHNQMELLAAGYMP